MTDGGGGGGGMCIEKSRWDIEMTTFAWIMKITSKANLGHCILQTEVRGRERDQQKRDNCSLRPHTQQRL